MPDDRAVRLRPLSAADEEAALAAHAELARESFPFLLGWKDQAWAAYLDSLEAERHGRALPEGWVPSTFLVAEVDGQLVGRVSVRHRLNEHLAEVGGHIGYCVRPGARRRGYATQILRGSLSIARDLGLERVLVTCDDDNVGSATIIERGGGVLDTVISGRDGGPPKRRYWIPVPA